LWWDREWLFGTRRDGKCLNFFKTSLFTYVGRLPLRVKAEKAIRKTLEIEGRRFQVI
jgi:hypothetical protein